MKLQNQSDMKNIYGKEKNKAYYPAHALRALGLLLADGDRTVGRGKTF